MLTTRFSNKLQQVQCGVVSKGAMLQRNNLEFFNVNCVFQKNRKGKTIGKSYNSEKRNGFCVTLVIILTILIIITSSKLMKPSKVQKTTRIKRHVKANEFNTNQNNINKVKSDNKILSEFMQKNNHPNHRYFEKESEKTSKNVKKKLIPEESRSLKSVKLNSENNREKFPNKILSRKVNRQKLTAPNKLPTKFQTYLGPTMRLKGIVIETENSLRKQQLQEKYNYFKDINNLMQYNSTDEQKKEIRSLTKLLKHSGAPFQLSTKGRKNLKRQEPSELNEINLKKHPIKIYLDIYSTYGLNKAENASPLLENIYDSVNTQQVLLPNDKKRKMIMKLNLFLKKSTASNRGSKKKNQEAEKKSFGWFFNKKKKEGRPKECSIIGLHPNEKYITAKWKDETGEWIHAKRVLLKYLKKEN